MSTRRSFLKALILGSALAFPVSRIALADAPVRRLSRIQELMIEMMEKARPVQLFTIYHSGTSLPAWPMGDGKTITFRRHNPFHMEH